MQQTHDQHQRTVLGQLAGNPRLGQPAPLSSPNLSSTGKQEGGILESQERQRLRYAGSRVWSELCGALKAVKRTSQTASETSAPGDAMQLENVAIQDHANVVQIPASARTETRPNSSSSRSQGSKASTRGELVRKLKKLGLPGNSTVVARSQPEGDTKSVNKPRSTLSAFRSEEANSPWTDRSVTEGYSTAKTSLDSRPSVTTSGKGKRPLKRRFPWLQTGLEFSLCTIAESGADSLAPTIATVERAAAAKMFLEIRLNERLHHADSRARRIQHLEAQLYYSPHLREEDKDVVRSNVFTQETCHLREMRVLEAKSEAACRSTSGVSPLMDNYEPVKILGKGSFGVVKLVREKTQDRALACHKQLYAMKVIRKSEMLRNSQEGHLRAERDFLVASEHAEWVVALMCSFQDATNLYLVMEYMPGGDFLGLLVRENILLESVARFYIAEMILAVEETHRLKFIHRDIKPDNFLISATGHLKISDFGLAFDGHWSHDLSYYNYHRYSLCKKLNMDLAGDETDRKERRDLQRQLDRNHMFWETVSRHEKIEQRVIQKCGSTDEACNLEDLVGSRNRNSIRAAACSVVGTSQYMAPEVIEGKGYDGRCDWWSIGIILFECLYGHTPFLAEEGRQKTKENITNFQARFFIPPHPRVSEKGQDLIWRLIQPQHERLCSRRYKLKDAGHLDIGRSTDFMGRHVFADDGEDIKAHRWFKHVPWGQLHMLTAPFVPRVDGPEDTRYFDESGSIGDMTESREERVLTPAEIRCVLEECHPATQALAVELVSQPTDETRLLELDQRIDGALEVPAAEKRLLKRFVRECGPKERKRPRDKILRDPKTRDVALDIRKKTAFAGYTWKRMTPRTYVGLM